MNQSIRQVSRMHRTTAHSYSFLNGFSAQPAGALPKEEGISKRRFHFEMPVHRVFNDAAARRAYAEILAELIPEHRRRRCFTFAAPVRKRPLFLQRDSFAASEPQ
jgi:hypothetical protein